MSILSNIRAQVESQSIDWETVCLDTPPELITLLLGGHIESFGQYIEDRFNVSLGDYTNAAIADQTKLENLTATTSQNFYSYYCIWAEESGSIGSGLTEWSFGNGDETPAALGGLHIGVNSELIGLALNVENGTGNVRVIRNGIDTQAETGLVTSPGQFIPLTTPLSFSVGDRINFRTVSATGTTSARVVAWFRVPIGSLTSVKGDKGDPGANGVPSQFARISLNTISNIKAQSTFLEYDTITVGDIPDMTINNNSIELSPGSYEVDLLCNLTSSSQRSNIGVNLYVGGPFYSTKFGQNYIRGQTGHNESAIDFTDIFTITNSSSIQFEFFDQTTSVNLPVVLNSGRLIIKKIS